MWTSLSAVALSCVQLLPAWTVCTCEWGVSLSADFSWNHEIIKSEFWLCRLFVTRQWICQFLYFLNLLKRRYCCNSITLCRHRELHWSYYGMLVLTHFIFIVKLQRGESVRGLHLSEPWCVSVLDELVMLSERLFGPLRALLELAGGF